MIQLPLGCTDKSTGKNTLDVGRCSEEPCSQSTSFSQSCGRKEDCCCGPRGEDYREAVEIDCGGSSGHNMGGVFYRIKECGCSTCVKQETVLQGNMLLFSCLVSVWLSPRPSRSIHFRDVTAAHQVTETD